MSANDSHLSTTGFDVVVAATQGSINATMKTYLAKVTQPEVIICYVANAQGVATPIDYSILKSYAKGSDPFSVPAGADPAINPDLQNLFAARFLFGIKASIGMPPGYTQTTAPNIVTLGASTSSVGYTLMCSEFNLVQYTPASGYGPASWMNQSQPDGNAWLFTSQVNLSLTSMDFTCLPSDVKANIKNLGGYAFSVQQLLFDLNNAALESVPQITGVVAGTSLYSALENDFVGAYFTTMQKNGAPVLGYTVTQSDAPPSTLPLTDLNFWSAPYVGTNGQPITGLTKSQQSAFTLNYLCSTNGDTLPAPQGFGWNWVDESQETTFDGVVAINRNTFANYFRNQLNSYVARNCYQTWVRVNMDGLDVDYHWSATPGQTPVCATPATGPTVLSYSYNSYANDTAGLGGDMGQMTLSSLFNLDVTFAGNVVTITQHLVIYTYIKVLATGDGANVVDVTVTDTFTIAPNA
ncbi:MAG TPA: hypothetical protein VLK84_09690, partial [Longimicrobium sp.]|nr:hypothetical protein [Longimicrobium sp.]